MRIENTRTGIDQPLSDQRIESTKCDPGEQLAIVDADIRVFRQVDIGRHYDEVLRDLIDAIRWRQESVKIFGKTHLQPRLSAWYGDPGAGYNYSGIKLEPEFWTPLLIELKTRVENITGYAFNSALLNYYRDHRDGMGMHSDDEKELGRRPVIASLSLGAERVFVLRHKYRKDLKAVKLVLEAGSLLLMKGDTQDCWKHGINRQSNPCGPRVNLTFRQTASTPVASG